MCHPWGQPRVHSHNHTLLPWDGSHDWIKGILDHYLLTGDNRSLECAHEQGRWIRSIPLPYEIARGTRRWSRLIQNLADLYRVTGHPEYLENFQARIDTAIAMRGSETNISLFQLDLLKEQPVMPSYGRLGFQHYYGINGVIEVAAATEDPHWKQLFLDEVRFLVGDGARRVPYQTDEEFAAWGRSKGKSASSGRDRLFYPLLAYAHRLTGERKWAEAAIGSAFFETTRSDWKDDYPNLGYADQVWAAYGIAFARLVGMGPEDEQEARQEGVTKGIPTALGDPKFEGATPGAWASGKDVYTAKLFNFMEIAMDDQVRLQGARALVVRETRDIGITKDLDRSKRLLPLTMSRNLILMEKPGFYRLSGFVRFEKHGRPDLALELDTLADDSRVRHDLNLPALLPAIRYANMIVGEEARSEISAASMLQAKQGNADEDVTPLLGDLTAEEDPESRWWRFSFPFEVRAPSTLRLILMYRYGLRPPGTVWFDDFSLEPIPAPPADALRCDVQKGPPVGP